MTDRIKGVYVTFEKDIRDDDAEPILNAIRQIRGVLSVEAEVSNFNDHIARERVRRELGCKLMAVLYPDDEG